MVLNRNWIAALIAFVVFSGLLVRYLDRVPQRNYCDFRVYYKAGQDLIKAKDIYVRETEDVTPFKYSPFFAFVFVPLSLLPIKISASVFFAINFVLTILFFRLSYFLIARSGVFSKFSDRDRLLIYALSLLCSMRYILLVWDSGQVSILMCVLVLAGLCSLSRDKLALAGAFFAAAILIKYTPAIFLFYFLFQRKFKVVLWSVFFIGLFLLVPSVIVGIGKEFSYLSSWIPSIISTSLDYDSYIDLKNQSVFSLFLRLFSFTKYNAQILSFSFEQVLWAGRVAALIMSLAIFIPGRSSSSKNSIVDTALLMICMSLFNPNAWQLNFVSLVLSYMLLIGHTIVFRGRDKFVLYSLIAAFILTNLMAKDMLGKLSEDLGCVYSFTTLGSLVLYSALLKLKFSRSLS